MSGNRDFKLVQTAIIGQAHVGLTPIKINGINQDILSELTRPPEGAKGLHESTNQKVDDPVNLLSKANISVEWITVGCGMDTGMVAKQVT